MSSETTSTISLISTMTSSSITPLSHNSKQQRSFDTACATLQSAYGFTGTAPMLPTLPTRKSSKRAAGTPTAGTPTAASTPYARTPKDYEAAYATLCSTYGFGGASPSIRPKA